MACKPLVSLFCLLVLQNKHNCSSTVGGAGTFWTYADSGISACRGHWGEPPSEGGPQPLKLTVHRGSILQDGWNALRNAGELCLSVCACQCPVHLPQPYPCELWCKSLSVNVCNAFIILMHKKVCRSLSTPLSSCCLLVQDRRAQGMHCTDRVAGVHFA